MWTQDCGLGTHSFANSMSGCRPAMRVGTSGACSDFRAAKPEISKVSASAFTSIDPISPDEPVTKTFMVDLLAGYFEKSDASNHNDREREIGVNRAFLGDNFGLQLNSYLSRKTFGEC